MLKAFRFNAENSSDEIMMTASAWSCPPDELILSVGELHVWRISLVQPGSLLKRLRKRLDFAELQKAESFHFQTDHDRYIIACSAKRDILSRYLQCEPREVRFTFNSHGKPRLHKDNNKPELDFNLAHSNDWALLAITKQIAVGVDVEFMRPNLTDVDAISQIFSSYERESIHSLPDELRVKAFFNCWTRKEAFVKATGLGLSYPLQNFDVSCIPQEPAKLLHIRAQPQAAGRWLMKELDLGNERYVASVVLETDIVSLRQWDWDNSQI